MSGLKQKLLAGTFWNSLSQVGNMVINFGLTFLLARLLTPADFGLIGMIMVVAGFLGYFSEFGMMAGIIRKIEPDEVYTNTAFWSGILFSIVIYVLLYLISPWIALFYKEPQLIALNRVLSLMFVLGGYSFVPIALEMKALRYRTISLINLAALFVSGLAAVLLAYYQFGVWALVCQQLVLRLVISFSCLVFLDWKPKLRFSWASFADLYGYGFHMTGNNLIKFFSENIDHMLVGKLLGKDALGVYTMAFRLSRFPVEKLWHVFGTMLFPAFASLQDDSEKLRRNYMKISLYGGLLLLPFIVGIVLFIRPLIHWVIGDSWIGAATLIQIFSLYIGFYCFSFGDEPLLMLKDIRLLNLVKIGYALLITGAGYIGIREFGWGLIGMAWIFSGCMCLMYLHIKSILWKRMRLTFSMHREWLRKDELKKVFALSTYISAKSGGKENTVEGI
jgi:PST family polysaccharide transporter